MPPRSLALLLLLAALWGGSFVFMRVAVPALGPIPLAYARVSLAAIALLALAFAQRRIPPFRTRWREFAVVGIVNSALPFALFCYAEQYDHAPRPARSSTRRARSSARSPAAIWLGRAADRRQGRRHDARHRGRRRPRRLASGAVTRDIAARDRRVPRRARSATRSRASTPSASSRACRASPSRARARSPPRSR